MIGTTMEHVGPDQKMLPIRLPQNSHPHRTMSTYQSTREQTWNPR